ncbi:cytochrome c peroxidase [uncultured Tateyamaria sp.]|uniref:cytochrome-c peroxidase n=1 Tax=uncultured Tateyamaria sp. TaxID=455651 RepID=UPI00262336FA|nr:cytochrome c peroxidase [uncultured Tateyamaria sp.]
MASRPACVSLSTVISIGVAVVLLSQAMAEPDLQIPLPRPLEDSDYLYDGAPDDALVELGRNLFFDPILSGNRNISCGTCHDPAFGSGDGLALGIGEGGFGAGPDRITKDPVTGRVPRNAQPLWNVGARGYTAMFHDGRVEALNTAGIRSPAGRYLPGDVPGVLAAQAFFPVTSPIEMAGQYGENPIANAAHMENRTTVWSMLAARVAAVPGYLDELRAAFPEIETASDVEYIHIAEALAAFQTVAFRSDQSPFDQVLRTRDPSHLAPAAQSGLDLFYGKAGCARCHGGPLLTDHDFHAIATPQIGPGKGHSSDRTYWQSSGFPVRTEDEGRHRVTLDDTDLFAFRTPSLRNVTLTGPWGHSGAFDRLEDMVRHHLDPETSLLDFAEETVQLPQLARIQRLSSRGSDIRFSPLEDHRREPFMARDRWVMASSDLTARIAAANELEPVLLSDREIADILAFLDSLTDESAKDRAFLVPESVPSGLPPQPRQNDLISN